MIIFMSNVFAMIIFMKKILLQKKWGGGAWPPRPPGIAGNVSVVISKNFNKGGSTYNRTHSLGVAQLQPRPYFQRLKHNNLV